MLLHNDSYESADLLLQLFRIPIFLPAAFLRLFLTIIKKVKHPSHAVSLPILKLTFNIDGNDVH